MPAVVVNKEQLDQMWSSQEGMRQLLQPELDSGSLSPHDFEITVRQLPQMNPRAVKKRGFTYGFVAGTAVALYGGMYKRPPWRFRQMLFFTSLAGMAGAAYGTITILSSQLSWWKSLDNPKDVKDALRRAVLQGRSTTNADQDSAEVIHDPGRTDAWEISGTQPGPIRTPATSSSSPPSSTSPQSHSRWDEIRTNSRGAIKPSSWDTLRQAQGKTRMADKGEQESRGAQPDSLSSDTGRTGEQERFDAMLEAERRISR